ncbi:hypothetical protein HKD37_04G009373 [Glycine soja]
MVWTADSSGLLWVSWAYRALLDLQYPSEHSVLSAIWKLNVAPKIKFFIWRIALNRVATGELEKEGYTYHRGRVEESICHILFECPCSSLIWSQWYSIRLLFRGLLRHILTNTICQMSQEELMIDGSWYGAAEIHVFLKKFLFDGGLLLPFLTVAVHQGLISISGCCVGRRTC